MAEQDHDYPAAMGPHEPADRRAYFVLDFDEAREAAELHAIAQDLNYVTEICDHLADRLMARKAEEEDDDGDDVHENPSAGVEDYVNRSLWVAALVTYARCFSKGIRHNLPRSLFKLTPGMDYTDLHDYYMNIRDKHVAHSVNELEAHEAVVSLARRSDGSLRVESLGMLHLTLSHLHHSEIEQLGSLADYARQYAAEAGEEANRRTAEKARALSQEQLRGLRPHGFVGQEGFVSRESTQAMKRARRGRDRKKKR